MTIILLTLLAITRVNAFILPIRSLPLNNNANIQYHAEIVLANTTYSVLIDTGSSDLWVQGEINATNTGRTVTVPYPDESITGQVKLAPLEFAGHYVPNQAFLEVPPGKRERDAGILGLGPGSSSLIAKQLDGPAGLPVLDRIFRIDRQKPNYFTILLDPTDTYSGTITVGEVLDEHRAVLDQPRLEITKVQDESTNDQHLQTLLDEDGLVGPDNEPIPFQTNVRQTANKRRATVVFDCGFTLPQLDRAVVERIYGRFHGAEFQKVPDIGYAWTLPCDVEVNITFKFAGKAYPIHPLDMTLEPERVNIPHLNNSAGQDVCIGTFQPFKYDRGPHPNYDMVLGMAFMRNVYTLFDYGDFIDASTNSTREPYIQLLSTTSREQAHSDFVTVRLGGIDTTGTTSILKAVNTSSSPRRTLYYVAAAVATVAILILLAILWICRHRRLR